MQRIATRLAAATTALAVRPPVHGVPFRNPSDTESLDKVCIFMFYANCYNLTSKAAVPATH